jgi:hypothetical protein
MVIIVTCLISDNLRGSFVALISHRGRPLSLRRVSAIAGPVTHAQVLHMILEVLGCGHSLVSQIPT